jgi:hypothetical protein
MKIFCNNLTTVFMPLTEVFINLLVRCGEKGLLHADHWGLYVPVSRGGHEQLFFESAIAIPQLEGSTSAIAIPQLLKKCCFATATTQFRNRNCFWSPQLQVCNLRSFISALIGIFLAVESGWGSWKKIGGKKYHATVPLRQVFGFQRNRQF